LAEGNGGAPIRKANVRVAQAFVKAVKQSVAPFSERGFFFERGLVQDSGREPLLLADASFRLR
jgi:hypothetical protein